MPLYEFHCRVCERRFERLMPRNVKRGLQCRFCGEPASRVLSLVRVQFKGDGFYSTDQRSQAGKELEKASDS